MKTTLSSRSNGTMAAQVFFAVAGVRASPESLARLESSQYERAFCLSRAASRGGAVVSAAVALAAADAAAGANWAGDAQGEAHPVVARRATRSRRFIRSLIFLL